MTRILGVDPGDVRIGLAISDPTQMIARPLDVVIHRSRPDDVHAILKIAEAEQAAEIVVGIPYGLEPQPGHQARKALRLVEALKAASGLIIHTWDESGSSQAAASLDSKRPIDARAAAVILQEFLDAKNP